MNEASTSEIGGGDFTRKKESKRPKYTKFTQQELPACKPLLTPGWVIATFMVVGIIFIPIGAVTLQASRTVVEIVHRYETNCIPSANTKTDQVNYIQNPLNDHTCTVNITVPKHMNHPVYVYYELDNFYQNHRRYVKSRNDQQLRGDTVAWSSLSACKPLDGVNGLPIVPCGLIAWSVFNDTYIFNLHNQGAASASILAVNRTGIAWKSDVNSKFGSRVLPSNFPNNNNFAGASLIGGAALDPTLPLQQDEALIVWMRTAALPNFRKLWGRIEQELTAGDIVTANINNTYNTYSFGGHKKLVLSTTSWMGGRNSFLGIAYLVVGLVCMLLAMVFFSIHLKNPRPLGDTRYLSWNKKHTLDEHLRT